LAGAVEATHGILSSEVAREAAMQHVCYNIEDTNDQESERQLSRQEEYAQILILAGIPLLCG
jgi:hypothetical protein